LYNVQKPMHVFSDEAVVELPLRMLPVKAVEHSTS
jgi:hypothetical protein